MEDLYIDAPASIKDGAIVLVFVHVIYILIFAGRGLSCMDDLHIDDSASIKDRAIVLFFLIVIYILILKSSLYRKDTHASVKCGTIVLLFLHVEPFLFTQV